MTAATLAYTAQAHKVGLEMMSSALQEIAANSGGGSSSTGTGELSNSTNSISKSNLLSNYTKVEDKLKILKDPNGNYAEMAKKFGYENFDIYDWRKGIQSFIVDGTRIEYHFVTNIKDGTVMGEKIFKLINGVRQYLNILP